MKRECNGGKSTRNMEIIAESTLHYTAVRHFRRGDWHLDVKRDALLTKF